MDAYTALLGLLAVLVGLAFTFFGYRLFMVLLPIWGAVAGFLFGGNLAEVVFARPFLADVTSVLVALVFAILFALGAYLFYWLAVALLAASFGYSIGLAIMSYVGAGDRTVAIVFAIIVAFVFAVAAIWLGLPRYVAIALTAVSGAFVAVTGVRLLLGQITVSALSSGPIGVHLGTNLSGIWLISAIVLAVVGIVYQVVATSGIHSATHWSYRDRWGADSI